ncbi:hypothetical protein A1O1_02465 [Capronia coronata CBS 617.96]|uniref:Uncharacterized protein n=1 Tax=Capronia coronata CBS 617.96 TaxID=1182541 RepID=W9YMC2_9EURO|nr:uncharacterized protein A1O1_02465 [Capronia coronata CBS 617.96]EXJ94072.1 hypothetical protein A1O1_02465 [Capronia coronata CBS 617.96]
MSIPSVLQYARFHGLATDHASEDILHYLRHVPNPTAQCSKEDDGALLEPDYSKYAEGLDEPKMQLGRQAAVLLVESITDPRPTIQWSDFLPNPFRWRRMKVEEPLLATDHDLDVAGFKRDTAGCSVLGRLLENVPQSNTISDELYEDEWNYIQACRSLKDIQKTLDCEKVHATREALRHLAETQRVALTKDEREVLLGKEIHKKPQLRPSSPPLMLEDLSTECPSASPSDTEAQALPAEEVVLDEQLSDLDSLMEEDWSSLSNNDGSSCASPTQMPMSFRGTPNVEVHNGAALRESSSDHERLCLTTSRASSHHEEQDRGTTTTPATPIKQGFSPEQKIESLIDRKAIQARRNPFSPIDDISSLSQVSGCRSEDEEFGLELDDDIDIEDLIFAERANEEMECRLKQEMISLPEACIRVPVPQLDMTLDRAPDHVSRPDIIASHLDSVRFASADLISLEENTTLEPCAVPCHHLGSDLNEKIEGSGTLLETVKAPQDIIRSEQMLWKQPGLRILDETEDSDDEIEEDADLVSIIAQSPKPYTPQKRPGSDEPSIFPSPMKKVLVSNDSATNTPIVKSKPSNLTSFFSASSALDTFLDLRGSKFRAVKQPCPLGMDELPNDPIEATQLQEESDSRAAPSTTPGPACSEDDDGYEGAARILVPATPVSAILQASKTELSPIKSLEWRRTVVVDMAMLRTHGPLLSYLERQGAEQLTLIYRDLNPTQARDTRGPIGGPDIILNPRGGLIFSSLQALNQKSLPGQDGSTKQSLVQSRIVGLLSEYDHVFVLISGLNAHGSFLQTTADTIARFTGFCSSLTSGKSQRVTPLWVQSEPGSHSQNPTLHRMIWQLISGHGFPTSPPNEGSIGGQNTVTLIHDETLWELFLRKAGLNAMAAQVVLRTLHRPNSDESRADKGWGLRRLVQMKAEERIGMFSEILGESMTKRMNAMIDTQ